MFCRFLSENYVEPVKIVILVGNNRPLGLSGLLYQGWETPPTAGASRIAVACLAARVSQRAQYPAMHPLPKTKPDNP